MAKVKQATWHMKPSMAMVSKTVFAPGDLFLKKWMINDYAAYNHG